MLKKTITFEDLDGNPVTEDFYFNLSKAEIAELELSHTDGLSEYLKEIIESKDGKAIIEKFKEIITMSIGRRSEDGRRFIKSEEITNEFLQTNAYSELFMELVTDAQKSAEFVNAIVPNDVRKAIEASDAIENVDVEWPNDEQAKDEDEVPAWIREDREPTQKELQTMSKAEMAEAFRRRSSRE